MLFSITTIICITRITRYIGYITEYGLTVGNFLKMIALIVPNMIVITTPITLIISTIFVMNKFMSSNELIILQNFSINKFNLLKPLLILNIIAMLFSYYIILFFEAEVNIKYDKLVANIKQDLVNLVLTSKTFTTFKNITFFSENNSDLINKIDNFIIYMNPTNINEKQRTIYAQKATINGSIFFLENGMIQEYYKKNKNEITTFFFDNYTFDISDYYSISFTAKNNDVDNMNILQLLNYSKTIKHNKTNIKLINKANGEIVRRIFTPLVGFILSLFSAVLMMKAEFSRLGNGKTIVKIYIFSISMLAFLLYNIKMCSSGRQFIILLEIIFSALTTGLVYLTAKKEYV